MQNPFRYVLAEDQTPKFWYNIVADLPSPPPPKPKHVVAAAREPQATPVLANLAPAAAPPVSREQQVAIAPAPVPAPVLPPRPISGVAGNPKPIYPPEARRRRAQGIVVLKVEVASSGAPLAVTVRTSSGHAVLDEAARDAVERWRFNPAIQAGVPVAGTVDVPVQFRLEE
jgi:protein TonB